MNKNRKIDIFDAYAMKKAGYSLKQIAKKYDVTGEAVRILLKKSFPNTKFKDLKVVKKIDFKCPECNKVCKVYPSFKQLTCSSKCSNDKRKRLVRESGKPTSSKYATKEQLKEFHRIRSSQFYHKNKNNPEYKKYKLEYDKKLKLKKKLEFEKYKEFYLKHHKDI